jgi:hypothetical protein
MAHNHFLFPDHCLIEVTTNESERSCIYVLQVIWLKCLYRVKWAVMYLRVTGLWLKCLYPGKWAVMYLRVTCLLIELHVPREVGGHVFTWYRSFDWSDCTKGSEQSCIYVLQVFWLKCLYERKWTVMYLRVTGLFIELSVPREVNSPVFTCYRSFDWSACTKGSERSCIYALHVFWLKCLFQGKWAVMYLRVTGLLIEVPVRREVSGHVFTCYRSCNWSTCTKGGEQSCIYVLQVFWLKWLYQWKWTVMYLRLTGLLIEVPVPREVSGHVFKYYMSFDWSACSKVSEHSCIYVLQVFWLKCLYQVSGHVFTCYRSFDWSACTKESERSCIYVLQVFWLKWLYQGKWAVMYLRVTGLLIEVTVPREVSGHVLTYYMSFDWSACTKGSEWSCIYVLHVFWLKWLYQGKWVVMYLGVTGPLIEVTVPREVSGHVFRCYRSFDWSACTKGSERSCICVLQVFWL